MLGQSKCRLQLKLFSYSQDCRSFIFCTYLWRQMIWTSTEWIRVEFKVKVKVKEDKLLCLIWIQECFRITEVSESQRSSERRYERSKSSQICAKKQEPQCYKKVENLSSQLDFL